MGTTRRCPKDPSLKLPELLTLIQTKMTIQGWLKYPMPMLANSRRMKLASSLAGLPIPTLGVWTNSYLSMISPNSAVSKPCWRTLDSQPQRFAVSHPRFLHPDLSPYRHRLPNQIVTPPTPTPPSPIPAPPPTISYTCPTSYSCSTISYTCPTNITGQTSSLRPSTGHLSR
jgi:hypothetical protein